MYNQINSINDTALMIMKILSEGDKYGYQLISELSKRSNGTFDYKAGTLYPQLYSLEEKGYIKSYTKATESNKIRRYYSLTETGSVILKKSIIEWQEYTDSVKRVLCDGTV